MNKQLRMGIKVEAEHKGLVKLLKKSCPRCPLPKPKEIYRNIAMAHLKEDRQYYNKLKKARL